MHKPLSFHIWSWLRNNADDSRGIYRCVCGTQRIGAPNLNAPHLRGTDLSQVAIFKE